MTKTPIELDIFSLDPTKFQIDASKTKEYKMDTVTIAMAPVSYDGKADFFIRAPVATTTPFGLQQDQNKPNKLTLSLNLQSDDQETQRMFANFIAQHNAIDEQLVKSMETVSQGKEWWGKKVKKEVLGFSMTRTIKEAGTSKNKKVYPPSMKFAIQNNHLTKSPELSIYEPAAPQSSSWKLVYPRNEQLPASAVSAFVPRFSDVTVYYGMPMVWKSNDKSWGLRWRCMQIQVNVKGGFSSGFQSSGPPLGGFDVVMDNDTPSSLSNTPATDSSYRVPQEDYDMEMED